MESEHEAQRSTLTRRELLSRATRAGVGLAAAASFGSLAGCAPVSTPAQQPGKPAAEAPSGAPAVVKGQTLTISIWPGAFANAVRQIVQPDFEKAHGVKLAIEEGGSANALAKLRAAGAKPVHTVVGVDDQFIPELKAEGLIVKAATPELSNLKDVYPEYVVDDGFGIGIAVNWNTLHYNSDKIKTAPTSYAAMWDPAYKGHVVLETLFAGTAWQFLVVVAALATGKSIKEAQYQPEAAFPKLKELKPNLHSIVEAVRTVVPQMVQGDIWLAVTGTNVVGPYIVKGAPIARAQPKEGAFMLLNTLALVNNAPLQEQGKDLINRMLSATAQLDMAKAALVGPTVRTAQVPAELRNLVPNGPEDASKMIRLDWSSLIKNRKALIDRWDKEISS